MLLQNEVFTSAFFRQHVPSARSVTAGSEELPWTSPKACVDLSPVPENVSVKTTSF